MSESTIDNDSTMSENTDNMAQNDQSEEALAKELNTDESIAVIVRMKLKWTRQRS